MIEALWFVGDNLKRSYATAATLENQRTEAVTSVAGSAKAAHAAATGSAAAGNPQTAHGA